MLNLFPCPKVLDKSVNFRKGFSPISLLEPLDGGLIYQQGRRFQLGSFKPSGLAEHVSILGKADNYFFGGTEGVFVALFRSLDNWAACSTAPVSMESTS